MKKYLFKSDRLGMRNFCNDDIPILAAMNQDADVMRHFPALQDLSRTQNFVRRMTKSIRAERLGFYAVDELDSEEFIGFIGMSEVLFDVEFAPCVEIGWRLSKRFWNKGYATEGARACLDYARKGLKLPEIYAFATENNEASIRVMKKIGMTKRGIFLHPRIPEESKMKTCVLYHITL